MDFVSRVRGVNFIDISDSSTLMARQTSLGSANDNKNIETVWERDPGDGSWFDLFEPSDDVSNKRAYVSSSVQTTMHFDLGDCKIPHDTRRMVVLREQSTQTELVDSVYPLFDKHAQHPQYVPVSLVELKLIMDMAGKVSLISTKDTWIRFANHYYEKQSFLKENTRPEFKKDCIVNHDGLVFSFGYDMYINYVNKPLLLRY